MEVAKVKIKVGVLELEYEGDSSFLKNGLNDLIEHVANISTSIPAIIAETTEEKIAASSNEGTLAISLSTGSIAARIPSNTGPELAICAMVHLELVKGKQTYGRKDILDEMKTAKAYYKQSMSKNHSAGVAGLVKAKKANEVSTGEFCLSASERIKLEAALA
jgi:hypothetical protein